MTRFILNLKTNNKQHVIYRNGDKNDLRKENLYIPSFDGPRLIQSESGPYMEHITNKGSIIKLSIEDSTRLSNYNIIIGFICQSNDYQDTI